MNSGQELGFAGALLPKTMLAVCENIIVIKVRHDVAVGYMFKEFTDNACERNRSVI